MQILKEKIVRYETDGSIVKGYDAGELIRCKDCTHWNYRNDTHRCFIWCVYTGEDGYCHRAERKEE